MMRSSTDTIPEPTKAGWRQRFLVALEAAVDPIVVIDGRGQIEIANTATVRTFGYELNELLGANVSILMPEPHASSHAGYLERYLETGEAHIIGVGREVEGRRKDGSVFPIRLSVGEGQLEGERFFVGQIQDISESKGLQTELNRREEELRRLLDNATVATAMTTTAGRFLEVNAACTRMLGYSREELLTLDLRDLSADEDSADLEQAVLALASGDVAEKSLEHRCLHKDGSLRYGVMHVAALFGESGVVDRFAVQVVDQTQRVEAEAELRRNRERLQHLQRLSILGEMAAGIAHEVNQPLGAISNYAHASRILIERGKADPAKLEELLSKVGEQAQRAGEVIRRLRALAKPRRASRDVIDVNATVLEAIRLAEVDTRLGSRLTLDLEKGLPEVYADSIQVQQIVLNLLRNATEAMNEAGTDGEIKLLTRRRQGEIEIAVRDEGPGVAESTEDEILSPFFTTKETGMGMGLAICQSIATSHGGRLWFANNEGAPGATFAFTLPVE